MSTQWMKRAGLPLLPGSVSGSASADDTLISP